MESFESASKRRNYNKDDNDSIDNDIDNLNINNTIDIDNDEYDIPDFIPSNYSEELALQAAEKFNDRKNLKLYIKHAHRLSTGRFEEILKLVAEYPQEKIKKSRAALFNYLCSKNGGRR